MDFDGDGHRDVVDSVPDVIASTANNLRLDGWVSGETWGYEVALPRNFNYLLADSARQMTMRQWQSLGLRRADGQAFPHPEDRAFLLLPAGARGPAFLMLKNFSVIMKYNPAEAYALAIAISPTACAAARLSCRAGRATSACLRSTSATRCNSFWRAAASLSASPTA